MSTKVFNTRLQLKYDSYANWSAEDKQFKLLAGEIAVVSVPAETDADGIVHEPAILFKVGDDNKTFNELPWASGLAADVHTWAKKEQGAAEDIKVLTQGHTFNGKTVAEALASLNQEIGALTGNGTSGSINDMIADAIGALDVEDAEVENQYVSAVSEVDGKIVVTRRSLPAPCTLVTGDTNGTVKFNGENVAVKGLKSAAYEAKDAFDAAGTGKAEAEKVLGTDTDAAGAATVHGALKAAAAAQDKADKAYVLPEGGIENDLSEAVKASLAKANSALQEHQDISSLATKEEVNTALAEAKKYADDNDADTKYGIVYDSDNKKIKLVEGETNVEIDASAFIKDGMISNVTIGDDNDLIITFNTDAGKENIVLPLDQLVDIYTGVEGARIKVVVNADKTISADLVAGSISKNYLDEEVKASLAKAETALQTHQNISHLAIKTEVDSAIATAEGNAKAHADDLIAGLDGNATATAEANGKVSVLTGITQADGIISKASEVTLEKVAKTGKLGDLVEDEVADKNTTDYVVFYCGTSEILTK